MKNVLIFITCLILGPIVGCLSSIFWHEGADTLWKPIGYFPYPVKTIIVMKPIGGEFWVESTESEIYQVTYPCSEDQICWIKTDIVPSDISVLDGEPIDYNISNDKCENNNFMYPLFHKITMCITSAVHAPDATHTVSLALTNNNKLWIWDQDYQDPFSILLKMQIATVTGGLIGYLTGILIVAYNPPKRKGKKK